MRWEAEADAPGLGLARGKVGGGGVQSKSGPHLFSGVPCRSRIAFVSLWGGEAVSGKEDTPQPGSRSACLAITSGVRDVLRKQPPFPRKQHLGEG